MKITYKPEIAKEEQTDSPKSYKPKASGYYICEIKDINFYKNESGLETWQYDLVDIESNFTFYTKAQYPKTSEGEDNKYTNQLFHRLLGLLDIEEVETISMTPKYGWIKEHQIIPELQGKKIGVWIQTEYHGNDKVKYAIKRFFDPDTNQTLTEKERGSKPSVIEYFMDNINTKYGDMEWETKKIIHGDVSKEDVIEEDDNCPF